MKYAIEIVPFGEMGEPGNILRLAQAAEISGWEAVFLWDHLAYAFGWPGVDPWIALAAVAATTQMIRLGVDVTPLPRRRPQVLALTLASLDSLSHGRVIFGAGLGGTFEEYKAFGEPSDVKLRAEMLDEGLVLLDRLMSGETINHLGKHYTAKNVALSPLPLQQPRIPIWIGGESQAALRRAARWDGWVVPGIDQDRKVVISPSQLQQKIESIYRQRLSTSHFDVAISGCSEQGESSLAGEYSEAGATWWLESLFGLRGSVDDMLKRVEAGPPG